MKKLFATIGAVLMAMVVLATPASAGNTGWLTYSWCPVVDGCGLVTTIYAHAATASDGSCSGSVGVRVRYMGGTVTGPTVWGASSAYAGGQNTTAYVAYK